MSKIDFETIERTSSACPSQWQGKLDDGKRMFYARYRWGNLTVEFSNKPANTVSQLFEDCWLVLRDGQESFDGYMSNWQFYKILLDNKLLHANLITRIAIKYFGRIFGYLEEQSFGRSLARGIRKFKKDRLLRDKNED